MRPIDADALVEAMTKFSDATGEDVTHGIFYTHIAPTIDAVPVRHGKWIDMDEQSYTWKIRCSCCDHERSMMSTQVVTTIPVEDATEILAHELAHAAVGLDHDHDAEWEKAFDAIFDEYNRIVSSEFIDDQYKIAEIQVVSGKDYVR